MASLPSRRPADRATPPSPTRATRPARPTLSTLPVAPAAPAGPTDAHFRALVEHASELILVLDALGVVRYASPSHARVLGWPPEALVGEPLLALAHPDDAAYLAWTLDEARRATGPVHPRPVRLARRDGEWCALDLVLTNLADDPAVRGLVVNARDVTEQAALAEQLRQAQKMEALGQLAGGVAHDFNNLLAAIGGFAQLVRGDLAADDPHRADLDEILAATARGSAVTRQLLTFSRRRAVETQTLDLAEAVRETGRMLRPLLPSSIALTVDDGNAPVWVQADRGQLEQVLLNLAVNARDAMPDGGTLAITVETRATAQGARGVLVVRDTGTGMSAAVREHLFEPFYTTKPAGVGTGLGLATVYGAVQQFGGQLWADSPEGAGTTFTIALPLAPTPDAAACPHPPADAAPTPATILLADDEEAVRRGVQRLLERAGHTVLAAADGAEALQRLVERDGRVDLVLTDATMPVLGGLELAERVRARYPGLPVVLMSGYAEPPAEESGAAAFAAVLQKPFSAEELAEAVERAGRAAR